MVVDSCVESYKGAPYGLMVKVPVEAGPFRGDKALTPIVVRQALHVDPTTAKVTAVSDPLPSIWHGIPLRGRQITLLVDRPGFMRNPTGCSERQIVGTFTSTDGTVAKAANRFQVADCRKLAFKPRLGMRLTGRRQSKDGGHPGLRAVVRQQGIGEAGIQKAVTRLPLSLALDPENAQELCEFEHLDKDRIEDFCPKGSIIGRARAISPLLNDPLVGNVYFVKNRRINKFGNSVATLPALIVALRGEVAINLKATSAVERLKLVTTFDEVPDAPISRFNLNIKGGRNGILTVVSKNLCGRQVTEADFDGQNGKRYDRDIRMKTPCRKRRPSAAKVCRKRTSNKAGFRRCVTKVKRNRARIKRRIAKRRAAAKRAAARS